MNAEWIRTSYHRVLLTSKCIKKDCIETKGNANRSWLLGEVFCHFLDTENSSKGIFYYAFNLFEEEIVKQRKKRKNEASEERSETSIQKRTEFIRGLMLINASPLFLFVFNKIAKLIIFKGGEILMLLLDRLTSGFCRKFWLDRLIRECEQI